MPGTFTYRQALAPSQINPKTSSIAGSIGNAAAMFSQLPMLEAQAGEDRTNAELKRSLMGAQAAEAMAKANETNTRLTETSLPEVLKNALLTQGVGPAQLDAVMGHITSGAALPEGVQLAPGALNSAYRMTGVTRMGAGLGDKNLENVAKADAIWRREADRQAVMADPSKAGVIGLAGAAADSKPIWHNIGDTGGGYNAFTGDGATLNPTVAALYGQKTQAGVNQANAAAGASRASAANSYASADLHRAQANEVRTGAKQQYDGDRGLLIDQRTGQAMPVMAGGQPIGAKDKGLNDTQAKANLFGGRMAEADKVLRDMEGQGVLRPGAMKSGAEAVLGMTPLIGDKLGDAAGSALNWTQSAKQQQVEQAQRDFINAVLRRESGAAIAASEFSNAQRQYFPQPGDSKAVIEQKRRNRQIATNLMLQEVPQAQRYQLGQTPAAPAAPLSTQSGGATGSWDTAPAPAAGWSIRRVN